MQLLKKQLQMIIIVYCIKTILSSFYMSTNIFNDFLTNNPTNVLTKTSSLRTNIYKEVFMTLKVGLYWNYLCTF